MSADSAMKAMGSLNDLLLDYVDTARVHDSNYEIAQTLVGHYAELAHMSLREMADLCFVSQASFSRFCRFLGFASFVEFKEALDSANYRLADDYARDFRAQFAADERGALAAYRETLIDVMRGALTDENLETVPQVLDAVAQARRVVFFSHHFLWHIGRYFQSKMLELGRYVELCQTYEHQLEAAASLGEGDVAIICSVNGSYLSHYHDIVREVFSSGAKVAVLTQNRHALYLNRADYVLTCGNTNDNDVGKYAVLMTVDYLVMAYFKAIKTKEEQHG